VLDIGPERPAFMGAPHELCMFSRYGFIVIVNYEPVIPLAVCVAGTLEILFESGYHLFKSLFVRRPW